MASPSTSNMWSYREGVASTGDIVGFSIEATDIDRENRVVHVNRTKNEIKRAPWYHEERFEDETYRSELGGYYSSGG